ncbi:hypothetical protein LCGC14_0814640 [marine sediment metagenome]|uniref:Uncharacterized protein n=1 Tax=marine sediment metagenome TaxID=412755 RepID=A0A0F9ST68_9ZZZZ
MQEFDTVEEWRTAMSQFLTETFGPPLAIVPLDDNSDDIFFAWLELGH